MIELDGKQYTVKTPAENTKDMLSRINEYCSNNNVKNSKNEVIQIAENPTSPLYMILWALGYLVAVIQKLIYNLACGMSIPNASEKQLLNLADLANIDRRPESKTTIDVIIYSSLAEQCEVTTEDTVTLNNVVYRPAFNLTIPAGTAGHIVLIAEDYGSFAVSEDSMKDFDMPLVGLRYLKQYASIQGQPQESIESLRSRIQRRTYSSTSTDAAADAIMALPGVTTCSIYFNDSPSQDIMINGIEVKARTALLFVQGYSSEIAKTFYQHMVCQTNPASVERTITQNYVTHSEQVFPVHIITPAQVTCFCYVYLNQTLTGETVQSMKDKIMELCSTLTAGQSVTSSMILDLLTEFKSYGLQGATVGKAFAQQNYIVSPEVDELLVFNNDSIAIVMPEVLT